MIYTDYLDLQGVAQCIDLAFRGSVITDYKHEPDGKWDPHGIRPTVYHRLVQTLAAALRGRGKDPFENYDNVCFIQDIVTAHRSVTNMGVQRSGPQLKAALEDIWHTLRGFDFRARMALHVELERHL